MEPRRQVELQLGHMCNNRCVFCVSGQRTAMGEARPVPVAPLVERVREARAAGHAKITLLGGEPTLQPGFLDVVRQAVALGFEEIVIFTNGARTAREAFIDEVLATGGRFTWRISIQGATRESHERTTKKPGSFDRILRTMEALRRRGQRITVNMCVVGSNYESVAAFPALLAPFGVEQLHLDLMRPLDAGIRSEDELRAMMPRHGDLVGPLRAMIAGFSRGYDVNIGNLPYCAAPDLAPWIHHDGEPTETIAVDGDDALSEPWDKYEVKRRDKIKPASCRACVFDDRCSGVFETYRRFHGLGELVPIGSERLAAVDPEGRLSALHWLGPVRAAIDGFRPPPPFAGATAVARGDAEVLVSLDGPEALEVALRAPGRGAASFERFSLHVVRAPRDRAAALAALRALWARLAAAGGRARHPVGDDVAERAVPAIAERVARLRDRAPFGALAWTDVRLSGAGRRAELHLEGAAGEAAVVWIEAREGGGAAGGYRIAGGEPTPALAAGLREVMAALRALPVAPGASPTPR